MLSKIIKNLLFCAIVSSLVYTTAIFINFQLDRHFFYNVAIPLTPHM